MPISNTWFTHRLTHLHTCPKQREGMPPALTHAGASSIVHWVREACGPSHTTSGRGLGTRGACAHVRVWYARVHALHVSVRVFCLRMCMFVRKCIRMHARAHVVHVFACACMCARACGWVRRWAGGQARVRACVFVCAFVCVRVFVFLHVCVGACAFVPVPVTVPVLVPVPVPASVCCVCVRGGMCVYEFVWEAACVCDSTQNDSLTCRSSST